jgi:tetratricopeptide (TPR) repeat protein
MSSEKNFPWRIDGVYRPWWRRQDETYSADIIAATTLELPTTVPCGIYINLEVLCAHLCHLPPYLQGKQKAWLGHMDLSIFPQTGMDDLSKLLAAPTISQLLLSESAANTNKRQEAEFMYALLSRDILVDIKSTEEEIIKYFRQKCDGNDVDMNVVDQFEEYYDAINAIFWYTRDTFLYRLLNKALREQDMGTLYSLRYFIKDLHLQIKQRHITQQQLAAAAVCVTDNTTTDANNERINTVYRGQLMSNIEFDRKIRQNATGFFSVSSFLSTTVHENLAREIYAGNRSSDTTTMEQSILFQIDIDQHVNKFPYANISVSSAFDAVEGEILFTMGSVFKILSVHLCEDGGYWNVRLKLTDEEDKELRILSEFIRSDIMQPNPLESLARLLIGMCSNKEAERYYLILLDDPTFTCDLINLASVFNNLGFIYQALSQYEKAIEYFEKTLNIKLEYSTKTGTFAATAYNNLGSIYNDQGKYDEAYRYYSKAIETELNTTNPNQRAIATYYSNIGKVCNVQERYTEAIEMFECSVEIRLKILPDNHPDIGTSLINISQVFNALGQYEKAINYLKKAFQNHFNSLPSGHPSLSIVYNNLGQLYHRQGKFKEASELYEKSLEIQLKALPADHPDIAWTYNNIAANYEGLGDFTKATEYFDKTLQIELHSLPLNHPNIAATYNNLASLLQGQNNLEEALMLYEKALQIWLIALSPNHSQVALCYSNISSIYSANGNNNKSMEYLNKALQIQISSSSSKDHPDFAPIYRNLGRAYYVQAKFQNALEMFEKALEIWVKVLPTNHMTLALLYADLSLVYDSFGEYEKSLETTHFIQIIHP